MVNIKKISSFTIAVIIIAAAMLALSFAGCSKPPENPSPFSVYRKDGVTISLWDKREDIEKIIDAVPEVIFEYEDDTPEDQVFELINYGDIAFGYDRAGNLLKVRIYDKDWKIANGLKVTDSSEDVKRNYPAEHRHTYSQNNDIYVSYDENGETIEFSESSPYIVRFAIENYAVKNIVVEKNFNLS